MGRLVNLFFICALGLGIALAAGVEANQISQGKGRVGSEGTVRIVTNPDKPIFGEIRFDLEQDLQIGKEDDDHYIFERIYDIKADDEGNIFVLDGKAGRIQEYDRTGRYVQTIGRKGQGPGEFEMPLDMFIQPKTGNLCVRDGVRIKIFDKSGQYQKEAILRNFPSEFAVDEDGNFWVTANRRTEKESFKVLEKINLKGETLLEIANFPYEIYTKRISETGAVAIMTGFEHDLHLARIDENSFVYGYSEKYELSVVDKQGKLLFKFSNDSSPRQIPAGAARGVLSSVLPRYQPFFYSIFADEAGRIYVLRDNIASSRGKAGTPKTYDIYSHDGYFLYQTTLPYGRQFCLKKGCLYARDVLEDSGLEVVRRYNIKNWSEIRASAEGKREMGGEK
jgi:hypothetical protein